VRRLGRQADLSIRLADGTGERTTSRHDNQGLLPARAGNRAERCLEAFRMRQQPAPELDDGGRAQDDAPRRKSM
jgi:hypothetical protein